MNESNDPYGQQPNPYGQQPPTPYGENPYGVRGLGGGPVPHPRGTTVLVLGILGLVCCGLLAPVAWVMGASADREVAAAPGRYSNAGIVKTGKILGIIGTAFIVLSVLFVLVVFVFGGVLGLAGSTTSSSSIEYNF